MSQLFAATYLNKIEYNHQQIWRQQAPREGKRRNCTNLILYN